MSAAAPETAEAPRSGRSRARRVAGWREHHGWSAAASLRRLAGRPVGTFLTVAVMGLALALPLAFYLLLANVQSLGDGLGRNAAVSVFLKPDQAGPQAELLAKTLRERADVAAVAVKTPQQGMDELATMQGFSGALHALDEHNPLPYVLEVTPRADLDAAAFERLSADLRGERAVDLVQDSGQWRQRLDALLALGRRIVEALALLLAVAALLVVGNTVRVDIASRSEEIGVLTLMGASHAFVRRPYLYAGIWYGLFAGVLAVLLALAVEWALAGPVAQLGQVYGGRLRLGGLPPWLLLATPLASALLGWLGARLVSAWQLRKAA
ncbi:permease-like cell division protein FtsX [Fulvimonas soli]|jgi:cell division transport system permease protein|uniref:Cell division protein FtsX n=1 Tax=Fulvimonas soli TaxID=155197 RepID=A0A316HTL1_9GAMM|nr:permease-like cell division protein FtsX [Fulvimonas soli]PWK83908.1 cell division protein FtsX [Fulvimonas soli]TNY25355.1 cell division protein [Fulvimonas soli]